jgi:hypothetical protein
VNAVAWLERIIDGLAATRFPTSKPTEANGMTRCHPKIWPACFATLSMPEWRGPCVRAARLRTARRLGLSAHREADGGGKDPDQQKSASGREAAKNRPELGGSPGACRHASKRKQHRGGEEHRGRKNENANRQPCLALSHTTRLCCTAASI